MFKRQTRRKTGTQNQRLRQILSAGKISGRYFTAGKISAKLVRLQHISFIPADCKMDNSKPVERQGRKASEPKAKRYITLALWQSGRRVQLNTRIEIFGKPRKTARTQSFGV
jgi:hypothetical protein